MKQGVSPDEQGLAEEIASELLMILLLLVYWRETDTEKYIVKTSHQNVFERNPDPSAQTQISTRWIWSEELDLTGSYGVFRSAIRVGVGKQSKFCRTR